jgi:anti-sigma factor RsiW
MGPTNQTRCERVRSQVLEYLTAMLPRQVRTIFEQHLAGCEPCRLHFERIDDGAHLRCDELVELVTDYLEDRLPAAERGRFETHLELCQGCARYLEQMRLSIRATGRLSQETVGPEAMWALLSIFRDWKRGGLR